MSRGQLRRIVKIERFGEHGVREMLECGHTVEAYERTPQRDENRPYNASRRCRECAQEVSPGPTIAFSLRSLARADLPTIASWRNHPDVRPGLRTPFLLTNEMQERWFEDVVCNRRSEHRYWAMDAALPGSHGCRSTLAAVVGLTFIAWENRTAELSVITDPNRTRQGIGRRALMALLAEGFDRMNLRVIYGEVYDCNQAIGFWKRMLNELGEQEGVFVPGDRKFWNGQYWRSFMFAFTEERWRAHS